MNAGRYGKLTVESVEKVGGHFCGLCRCDCGVVKTIRLCHLKSGAVISCGCAHRIGDITGRRFGRLVVVSFLENAAGSGATWNCRCDCGGEKAVPASRLLRGYTKSCGCAWGHRHGMSGTREHCIWTGIIDRCCNPNSPAFAKYGGRGISICEEWRSSFTEFLKYVGVSPSKKHSIDRYTNNDGNYEPGNVRWATRREQALNTRRTLVATINGDTRPLAEWCDEYGMDYSTVIQRVKKLGWNIEDALTRPVRQLRAVQ